MTVQALLIFALYTISGIFTLKFLKRHGFRIAYVVYLCVFGLLFIYIPYITGGTLFYRLLTGFLHERALENMQTRLIAPVLASVPYFSLSFIVAIALSLFLVVSLAIATVMLVRVVCRALSERLFTKPAKRTYPLLSPAAPIPPERAARYIFCRYNC